MSVTTAKYLGTGRVEATHNASGDHVTTDAVKQVGGRGEHQTPVELLGNSLAACALTIMGLQAEKAGADFAGCYAEVGECEENMEVFTVTRIPIVFHLKADFDTKLRKKLESFAAKACFVGNSLHSEKAFTFVYE